MKKVISASRRTDLTAFFPDWLASVIREGRVRFLGPAGGVHDVDLKPEFVHTVVLWSKDFRNLIGNRAGLADALSRYDQIYCHFTVTGLGGSAVEKGVAPPAEALRQLAGLVRIAGSPRRVSLRVDPILYWKEGGGIRTNLGFFETACREAARFGVRDIRFSFAQWYGKAARRAAKSGFPFVDPAEQEKKTATRLLSDMAASLGLSLYSCSQDFLTGVPGVQPSSCIDGGLLEELHPLRLPVSRRKDRTQRKECGCTESVDIGSYALACPHCCVYCYANPKMSEERP